MKTRAKTDEGKSPYSATASVLVLLLAGLLITFEGGAQLFHIAR
jgi:hypothetical protein